MPLWEMGDPNTREFRNDVLPELGESYELPEHCSNTVRIAENCAPLVGQETRSRDGVPVGDEPEVVRIIVLFCADIMICSYVRGA